MLLVFMGPLLPLFLPLEPPTRSSWTQTPIHTPPWLAGEAEGPPFPTSLLLTHISGSQVRGGTPIRPMKPECGNTPVSVPLGFRVMRTVTHSIVDPPKVRIWVNQSILKGPGKPQKMTALGPER